MGFDRLVNQNILLLTFKRKRKYAVFVQKYKIKVLGNMSLIVSLTVKANELQFV